MNLLINLFHPTIDPANNRFTTGQGYVYDLSGNLIQDAEGRSFVYDGENKQTEVRDQSQNVIGQYFYDSDGRRVKKVVPSTGETTIFVYDASGKLVAEYSTIVEPQATAKVSYLTTDHLGSPRINTDATGQVTARHDYMPFGEEIGTLSFPAGTLQPRTQVLGYTADTVRKQFTGFERDNEISLDFAQARYYNPMHGRFTSVDPENAGADEDYPQSWKGYAYGGNNPILFVDPDGLEYKICDLQGNCWTHTDANFKKGQKLEPDIFQETDRDGHYDSGNILDSEGNVIGTYERISIDREYQFIYSVAEESEKKQK